MRHQVARTGAVESSSTLFDRAAIGFFSGLLALLLGSIVWFALAQRASDSMGIMPLLWVWWFTAAMAIAGVLRLNRLVVGIVSSILNVLLTF